MSFDISSLEPQIRDILSAPGTDLTTISAKSVRRKLLEVEPSLTADFLKEHKEEVDAVIGRVFEAVSAEAGEVEAPPQQRVNGTVKPEEGIEDDGEDEAEAPSPPPKKPKKTGKKELSDAELARQLSVQINGRARRSGTANGSTTKKKRAHKSADFVYSDSDEDGVGSTKKKKRKSGGGGAKGGFAKEYSLSEPLAALLNVSQLSRPQVVKHLWEYIKGNELQNPSNKREIMCDARLRNVFGCEKINMFKMNKVLGMHLHENGE